MIKVISNEEAQQILDVKRVDSHKVNNEIIEKTIETPIEINFDYISMNDVMKVIKELSPTILFSVTAMSVANAAFLGMTI